MPPILKLTIKYSITLAFIVTKALAIHYINSKCHCKALQLVQPVVMGSFHITFIYGLEHTYTCQGKQFILLIYTCNGALSKAHTKLHSYIPVMLKIV